MALDQEQVSTRILTIPNAVSAVRLALVPIFVGLFVTKRNDPLAFATLFVIGSTDWVDGFLARRLGQVSRLGKVIDPVADRIAVIAIVVALVFRGIIPLSVSIVILSRDVLVSIVFPILEALGYPRIPVNLVGKAATAAIYSGVGLSVMAIVTPWHVPLSTYGGVLLWTGAALYWLAAALYSREIGKLIRGRKMAK